MYCEAARTRRGRRYVQCVRLVDRLFICQAFFLVHAGPQQVDHHSLPLSVAGASRGRLRLRRFSRRRGEADRVHRHLIPGHGAIDFASVFSAMARMGYKGDICLELYPYTDTPEEAGRESLEYLRPLFDAIGLEISG